MKKIIALLCIVSMFTIGFAGCGNKNNNNAASQTENTTASSTVDNSTASSSENHNNTNATNATNDGTVTDNDGIIGNEAETIINGAGDAIEEGIDQIQTDASKLI